MSIDEEILSCCSEDEPNCLLNDRQVQKILSQNHSPSLLNYEKGENVFKEGKPIIGFYIICEGMVKEVSCSSIGNEITLNVFKPGDILTSDAFFFDEGKYQTRSQALTEVEVLFIEKAAFPDLMSVAGAKIGMKLARNMKYLRKNLEFSFYPVLKKTAYWLNKLIPDSSNKFSLSNKELAEIVGCSDVTVSKKLSKLAEDGLIEKRGREIIVPDKARLREEAVGTRFG